MVYELYRHAQKKWQHGYVECIPGVIIEIDPDETGLVAACPNERCAGVVTLQICG